MKNFAFKMLLFGLCSMIWATTLSGETGRAMAYPQAVVFQTLDNGRPLAEEQKVKGLMQRNNKEVKLAKRFFQKREGQNGHRGWLILAMVLLYLSVFICVIYGLGSIAIAIGLGGGAGAVILALVAFAVGAWCISGIIKTDRKLRQLKHGDIAPDETPH